MLHTLLVCLQSRRPPGSTRTDTRFPHATRFLSKPRGRLGHEPRWISGKMIMGGSPDDGMVPPARPRDPQPCPPRAAELEEPFHHQRSEENTSELQSLMRIWCAGYCLKKKKTARIGL